MCVSGRERFVMHGKESITVYMVSEKKTSVLPEKTAIHMAHERAPCIYIYIGYVQKQKATISN